MTGVPDPFHQPIVHMYRKLYHTTPKQCKDHNALLKHELDEVKAQNFALNKELYKLRNMLANTSRAIQASLQVRVSSCSGLLTAPLS